MSLVPLDDRPCNRLFPGQLAPVAGWEVCLPPRQSLGWFTNPGYCGEVADWLCGTDTQRLVVSLDMLCYGGLVASRSPEVELAAALDRLGALRRLRHDRPDAVVYAFSLITRLGTTVASAADLDVHELLRAYSQLVDRVERLGEERARAELGAVLERLDTSSLERYLEVRRRNHAINRAAIQLAADGVVDYLVLAQEDAAPVGVHVPEQIALRDQVREFRVADRVSIHPGADEVGLLLTARHCLDAAGRRFRIAADYSPDAGADVVPRFEDNPLRDTLESHVLAAGARPAPPVDADAVLVVHTPHDQQPDITEAPCLGAEASLAARAETTAERVRAAEAAGRTVGLADTAYCNGADPELIAALGTTGAARRLEAFAAWNTAANTLGTAIGHLCLLAAADLPGTPAQTSASRRFLLCRLADDFAYQSQIRQRAIQQATHVGADPFALGGAWAQLEQHVSAALRPLARSTYSDLGLEPEGDSLGEVSASLPWHRLFEVEVELTR